MVACFIAQPVQVGGDDTRTRLVLQRKFWTIPERRYSPPECISVQTMAVCGAPDAEHVSTSYVQWQDLTMRIGIRRFTRPANAFSKKIENHACALHFTHYNFSRVHQTLKTLPTVAAGVANHVWTVAEIVGLLDRFSSN